HDAAGVLVEAADTDERSHAIETGGGANWRQPFAGGRLHLDLAARQERVDYRGDVFPTLPGTDAGLSHEHEDLRELELRLRWSRLRDGRRIAGFASARRGRLDAGEFESGDDGDESFVEDTRTGETLAGVEFGWDTAGSLVFGAGLELAHNTLESRARLHE